MKFLIYITIGLVVDYVATVITELYTLKKCKIYPPEWWYVFLVPLICSFDEISETVKDMDPLGVFFCISTYVIVTIMWPITLPLGMATKVRELENISSKEES